MEKLGLGPEILVAENPGLIYARLTGFGQAGPYSKMAGHDINYLAMSGILSRLGRKTEPPVAPINLLADFAGGGLICAMGIMAALFERTQSKQGQVIDANMVEGAAYVGSWIYLSQVLSWSLDFSFKNIIFKLNFQKMMIWGKDRGENVLDTGAHFYETYETKDGKFMSVGAIEPQFYTELLSKLQLEPEDLPQFGADPDAMKAKLTDIFKTKTRQEWTEIFDMSDACVTPILELNEAPDHPHNKARKSFVKNHAGDLSAPVCPS
jgi:alpha-methylacyl-CoA racemase